MKVREKKKPGFLASISMIIVLLALVVYSVRLDISIIPALVLSICYSLGVAYYYGYGWDEIMESVYEKEKGYWCLLYRSDDWYVYCGDDVLWNNSNDYLLHCSCD